MELTEILTIAFATLIVLVACHFAVFWVVRTLYPPPPQMVHVPVSVPMPAPVPEQTFAHPPPEQQQHVTLPTYEEAPRMEVNNAQGGGPPIPAGVQGPPAARDPRLDTTDPRSGVPTNGAI